MEKKVKEQNIKRNICLFLTIIYGLIISSKSFIYFKAFNLLSNNILFISDEGVIKYVPETNNKTVVHPFNLITTETELDYISFAQLPLDEGGYVFCRIKEYIYIYDEDLNNFFGNIIINDISNIYCSLVPYKTKKGIITLIISHITGDQKIKQIIYEINTDQQNFQGSIILTNETEVINKNGETEKVLVKAISCELMSSLNYTNKLLTCFVVYQSSFSIVAVIFNPENSLSFLYFSDNSKITNGLSTIYSTLDTNKQYSLICFVDNSGYFSCLIYNSDKNAFNNIVQLIGDCKYQLDTGVKYISDKQEYSVYCSSDSKKMNLITFDQNFNVKYLDGNNNKCYKNFDLINDECNSLYSYNMLYVKNYQKFYVFRACYTNNEEVFTLLNVSETCNKEIEIEGLIINNNSTLISSSIIKSTSLLSSDLTIKSTLIIPSTSLKSSSIKKSTLLKSLISSKILKSSIPEILDTKINISSLNPSSFSSKESTILNSFNEKIEKKNNLSSLITLSSPIISLPKISTFNIPTTIFSIKSESLSKTSSIINSKYSSLLFSKTSKIFSSFVEKSSSKILTSSFSISQKSSQFSSLVPSISSSFNNNILQVNKLNYLKLYEYGEIMKGRINKTKEELENNLNEFMEVIEVEKKYEINGIDYNMTITPINTFDSFKSANIDFSLCEEVLRKHYNIPQYETLIILQIEINKMEEKALTNQIEYAIYNNKKQKLDLSVCKDAQIKITYNIINKSPLNKTLIEQYSELGIDILDRNDSFFNDLCYPFSILNNDVILKDRVLDIYQNYSLCDNDCIYEQINTDNMTVTCSCQIKTEIKTEVSKPVFREVVQDTFKNSNFGVIRCYNLVLNFGNKIHNIGFILFLLFVIFHIICYIYYFINGINSIVIFVYKEMVKNNYISRMHNPKKKNKNNIKFNSENELNNINDFNSQILLNCFDSKTLKRKYLRKAKDIKNKTIINADKNKDKEKNKKFFNTKININQLKNNKSIFIFNCNYDKNYYRYKNKSFKIHSTKKCIFKDQEQYESSKANRKKKIRKNVNNLNEEKDHPGYYNLILINANNSLENYPPESKYILDNYNYEEAIKYETRTFWRIYFIFLLCKENIINTFFFNAPLELKPLRLSMFIFSYSCDFALNALFYFNDKISEKYHYEGDSLIIFTIINNMTISIFSTVSSYLLTKFLNSFTDSKDSIEGLFRNEEQMMRKDKKYKVDMSKKRNIYFNLLKIYKCLKLKIFFYIMFELSIMIFFLYYTTAFCEVYKDTQISWIYDSFLSFLLSIPIELLISFVLAFLYLGSIKFELKFVYNFVMFLYGLG